MTEKTAILWAETVTEVYNNCNWAKIKEVCDYYDAKGDVPMEDYSQYFEPLVEVEFPSEELEELYLPVFENGNYEQLLNAYRDLDSFPEWKTLCRAIKLVCDYGW